MGYFYSSGLEWHLALGGNTTLAVPGPAPERTVEFSRCTLSSEPSNGRVSSAAIGRVSELHTAIQPEKNGNVDLQKQTILFRFLGVGSSPLCLFDLHQMLSKLGVQDRQDPLHWLHFPMVLHRLVGV